MCQLPIQGVHVFDYTGYADHRGAWTRLIDMGHPCFFPGFPSIKQLSLSENITAGTFRGLHLLDPTLGEFKLVTVLSGSIQDVLLDTRPDSSSFGKAMDLILTKGARSVLIPPGVAHGFLTLEAHTNLLYGMTVEYSPSHDLGFNWRTSSIAQRLLFVPQKISSRDEGLPVFTQGPSEV